MEELAVRVCQCGCGQKYMPRKSTAKFHHECRRWRSAYCNMRKRNRRLGKPVPTWAEYSATKPRDYDAPPPPPKIAPPKPCAAGILDLCTGHTPPGAKTRTKYCLACAPVVKDWQTFNKHRRQRHGKQLTIEEYSKRGTTTSRSTRPNNSFLEITLSPLDSREKYVQVSIISKDGRTSDWFRVDGRGYTSLRHATEQARFWAYEFGWDPVKDVDNATGRADTMAELV